MEENQFLQLIAANEAIIHKICRLYRDSSADREDLFQEIVFQLWRSIDSFRNEAKPSTFVYRVALNTAIAAFRKNRSILEYTDELPEPVAESDDTSFVQRREELLAAIKKLEEADRAVMALLLDDLSYSEIGEVLGISPNNVGVRINRVKNKIKKLLNRK